MISCHASQTGQHHHQHHPSPVLSTVQPNRILVPSVLSPSAQQPLPCRLRRSNHCPAYVYKPCTHKCDLILDRHEKEVPRAPVCVVDLCADMVMQGQTSSSNEILPNAASSITILPPPHPPTNTTAKVGSAWLASIYTLVVEQSACHLVVFFSQ